MRRGLLVLACVGGLGAVGAAGWMATQVARPPEVRLCAQMQELCGFEEEVLANCLEVTEAAFAEHPDRMDDVLACGASTSCREATGCLVGVGADAVAGDVGEFLKGFGRGLGIGR